MFKALNHAALPVLDLKRALAFYQEEFQFKPYHISDDDWAMLRLNDSTLSLVLESKNVIASEGKKVRNPAHLGVSADSESDVKTCYQSLQKRVGVEVAPLTLHRDQSYGFYFKDTEGNQLECIYIPTLPVLSQEEKKEAVVLFAHGSSSKEWTTPIESLVESLNHKNSRFEWYCSFMEGETKKLNEVVQDARKKGHDELILFPYFLSSGKHVREDIPKIISELGVEETIKIKVMPALGRQKKFRAEIMSYLERSVMEAFDE